MTKSILITGCSSGIGYRTAILLKKRGYHVFASARKTIDVEKLATQGLEAIQLDVTDTQSRQQALDFILKKTGGTLDALFNNAGLLIAGAFEDLDDEMIEKQFAANVFGVVALTRLVLPIMRKQGHGRIIQNSSILGVITLPYYSAYNASKFALEGFSLTLRQELYNTHIRVAIINPGPIESKLRAHSFEHYQQTLDKNSSLHQNAYQKLEQSYFHPDKKNRALMRGPDIVVKQVIHALEAPNPKIHYYIGFPIKLLLFLKCILPERLFDTVLRRV